MIVSELEYKIYHLIEFNTIQKTADIIGVCFNTVHIRLQEMVSVGLLKKVGCKYKKNKTAYCKGIDHKLHTQVIFIKKEK